jgi:hypothetical protein
MRGKERLAGSRALLWIPLVLLLAGRPVVAQLLLGPEEIVKTTTGAEITVTPYSVPSFVCWNGDALKDLVIGEGSSTGKVRVYLNVGTPGNPQFSNWFYAQAAGADLAMAGGGCMGLFPRVVYWEDDNRKDLLVGSSYGTIRLFRNVNTDDEPKFDGGTNLQVGPPGAKSDIYVGSRATPGTVDWNNDGKKDLVVGAMDGKIRVFINEGTDTSPGFRTQAFAQNNGADLVVPLGRSSPVVADLDADGRKDLLAGDTEGQLLLYRNTGTDAAPSFSGYVLVSAAGVAINLAGSARSRPFVCDWNDDGTLDVLIGASDGKAHLYPGIPIAPGDFDADGNVDLTDFEEFQGCFNGPNRPAAGANCGKQDLDGDADVDLADFLLFQACFNGPNRPAACQ